MTLSKPSSLAKMRALRAANTSTISTEVGRGINCVVAAITRPWLFRMMERRPASACSLKTASTKLILTQSEGGGFHLMRDWTGRGFGGVAVASWNSWRASLALELSSFRSATSSPNLSLFLLNQIWLTSIANKSVLWGCSKHVTNTSRKDEHSCVLIFKDSKCTT